jgi:energy-coupling factor transport system permease protein
VNTLDHVLFHTLLGETVVAYAITFLVPLISPMLFIRFVGLKGLRNVLSYEAADTPVHRLDPRIKLLYPILITMLSVLLGWAWTYLLFGLTLVPWVLLRPSTARLRVPALLSVWSQGLYYTTPKGVQIINTLVWLSGPVRSRGKRRRRSARPGLRAGVQQA